MEFHQKGNNMLDFVLSDGKRMTLEDCGDCLNAKLWTENGEYMGEINWNIDSIADMLFTEQQLNHASIGELKGEKDAIYFN